MLLEDRLVDAGATVVHVFGKVRDALSFLGSNGVDLAIVDVNVAGEAGELVGEVLADKGIPFVFSSGYDESGMDERWRNWPALRKPYGSSELTVALRQLVEGRPPAPLT